MDTKDGPKLDAPGAGLPAWERWIGKLLLNYSQIKGSRDSFNVRFQQERVAISQLVNSCGESSLETRVLIRRPLGMEDSSRYWSVLMTLDHLRIVNQAITGVLGNLGKGIVPERKASIAAAKPDPAVTSTVMDDYEKSCDALLAAAAGVPTLKTKVKYNHPWFGPLDALAWHALAGGHMGIHRVQIERIIQGLKNTGK